MCFPPCHGGGDSIYLERPGSVAIRLSERSWSPRQPTRSLGIVTCGAIYETPASTNLWTAYMARAGKLIKKRKAQPGFDILSFRAWDLMPAAAVGCGEGCGAISSIWVFVTCAETSKSLAFLFFSQHKKNSRRWRNVKQTPYLKSICSQQKTINWRRL